MKKRYIISFVVAIIILSVLFLWNVGAGSVDISTSDLFAILAGSGKDETFSQIVWKIRLPRILAAILLGGALSVSGFLLQSFFQNPIAGPYVLGISSGAKLVVALTMIFLLEKGIMISSFGMVMAAFVGSMLAMGFVLLISFRVSKMSLLVVCGIMIGLICGFVGAGGGMMMLLILTSVLGYELKTAVGTSVFIMAFTAFTGAVSHFMIVGAPDWTVFILCVVFTLIWARIAARFANKATPETLNRATGVILVILGIVVLGFSMLS